MNALGFSVDLSRELKPPSGKKLESYVSNKNTAAP